VGRITGPATFAPAWGAIVKDRDELSIPLALSQLPSPAAFADAITSLSPQQRRFATALRAAQLQSSLTAVLVLAIKPQLEVLLRLPHDALTREIGLTRDLTELFIKHQVRVGECCVIVHGMLRALTRASPPSCADPGRPAGLRRTRHCRRAHQAGGGEGACGQHSGGGGGGGGGDKEERGSAARARTTGTKQPADDTCFSAYTGIPFHGYR